jgi:sporulation related protein
MADRYQNRTFPPGNDYDRDAGSREAAESDPLAELARLIGQTDPFGTQRPMTRANLPVQQPARPADPEPSYDHYADDHYAEEPEADLPPPAPPAWMQRAARHEAPPPQPPEDDYPSAVHPLHRYAASQPPAEPHYEPEPQYESEPQFSESAHEPDLSRYDEALYGGFDSDAQNAHQQNYADDGYAYEEDQHFEEQPEPRRRGGLITVAAVLALAVFGVGGALAYRSYTSSARSGEPPIIRADAGPTKIIPAPADAVAKVPDRIGAGDGTEKMVPREETPIDPTARSGPRVVLPPLTPNGGAPLPATIMPGGPPPSANGTFSNNEPHRVRTLPVRGDQADAGVPAGAPPAAAPVATAAPAKPAPRAAGSARSSANPNAANANAPLSLAPQSESAPAPDLQRVATNAPNQVAPSVPATPSSAAASGSYLVSITSQPSEAEAQASYRALQNKYPSVLGSQSPIVARANSKSGTTTYRAGPAFGSSAEAAQFCRNYTAAGGQCWVVKN